MRRIVALGTVGVALAAPAAARADATLAFHASKATVGYGRSVTLAGKLKPAAADRRVHVYRRVEGRWKLVDGGLETAADGTFALKMKLRKPGAFRAKVDADGAGTVVSSETVRVELRPRFHTAFEGRASIGRTLWLTGRIVPRAAGVLVRRIHGHTHRIRVGRHGGFHFRLPTGTARRIRVKVRLRPARGYVGVETTRRRRLSLPTLTEGSRGPAVRALERQLRRQHFLLRNVNKRYGYDTLQALYAYQWVHGLSRTGTVGTALWHHLAETKTPKARRPSGDHIEISKSHQVIYEVRSGKVVNVIHTSTGATGNTPVGTWHVYWKDAGYNAIGMYYSMYFLRGFAIHGYHSVPPWPASHGCGRIELWAAPGLFGRWGVGTTVVVFP